MILAVAGCTVHSSGCSGPNIKITARSPRAVITRERTGQELHHSVLLSSSCPESLEATALTKGQSASECQNGKQDLWSMLCTVVLSSGLYFTHVQ